MVISHLNLKNMFKRILRPLLHIGFLFKRPLTFGVRAICFNAKTKSVLLVKHIYADGWDLPGGGVEVGESVVTALKRELKEEVGLNFRDIEIIDIYHNNTVSKRDHVIIFSINSWKHETLHVKPKLEIINSSWYKLDELPEDMTPCTNFAINSYKKKFKLILN